MGKTSAKKSKNDASSSESEENFDRENQEEEIDVEFEAFGICDKDIDGIIALLKQAYANENLDVRCVAEILANQQGRGCIFMTAIDDEAPPKTSENEDDDDDEIYGVVSYIDLKENLSENCVKEILKILRQKSAKNEEAGKIFDDLATGQTSAIWLINERLINLPYHIALPALKNISQELENSGQNYDHFVLISKINKSIAAPPIDDHKVKKAKKRKSTSSTQIDQQNDVIYWNAEEEFLSEECKLQFDYIVEGSDQENSTILKPHRRVLIFDRSIFERFLQKLEKDITNNCD